jgi:hypothetical protein
MNYWMDNLVSIYHGGTVKRDRYRYVEFVEMQCMHAMEMMMMMMMMMASQLRVYFT